MALLKEEETEPAIFTARLYSFPLFALATPLRLLADLDDLLCDLDEVFDAHPRHGDKVRMKRRGKSDAKPTEVFAVLRRQSSP